MVVLPMPILWRLQMAVSKKAALTGMFGIDIVYGSLAPSCRRCKSLF